MENASWSSNIWNNVTASSSTDDDDLAQYVAHISNRAVKVIYIIIGTIGIIDNLFVILIFALFIKITDKVLAIGRHCSRLEYYNKYLFIHYYTNYSEIKSNLIRPSEGRALAYKMMQCSVASSGLVSPRAATEGVAPIFLEKKNWRPFYHAAWNADAV